MYIGAAFVKISSFDKRDDMRFSFYGSWDMIDDGRRVVGVLDNVHGCVIRRSVRLVCIGF